MPNWANIIIWVPGPVGDYLRQLVELNGQPVALLVWGPACYALKDRDLWIGWSAPQRELAASAAARLCDRAGGPTAIGYGGARGGGKSHWLLAQMGADDCQRVAGLNCLLLRKVGKANTEHFEELQRRLFGGLKHEFSAYRGVLRFGNGSQIVAGHYQAEKDIDNYLGLEYDVIRDRGGNDLERPETPGHLDVLPDIQGQLAPAHLFHHQSRRRGACLVSVKVHRSFPGGKGNGDAVYSGAGG